MPQLMPKMLTFGPISDTNGTPSTSSDGQPIPRGYNWATITARLDSGTTVTAPLKAVGYDEASGSWDDIDGASSLDLEDETNGVVRWRVNVANYSRLYMEMDGTASGTLSVSASAHLTET